MNHPRYQVLGSYDRLQFEFVSEGLKGRIIKRIEYTYMPEYGFWNLGFGDYNAYSETIDDQVVSDNGDGRKVLATVVFTMNEFFSINPDSSVFFSGSTDQRTRIYGWAITQYWQDIVDELIVYGVTEDGTREPFMPRRDYLGFVITRK